MDACHGINTQAKARHWNPVTGQVVGYCVVCGRLGPLTVNLFPYRHADRRRPQEAPGAPPCPRSVSRRGQAPSAPQAPQGASEGP